MAQVNIFRIRRSDQGTQGILSVGGFTCKVLELPWRDNRPNISCIPAGSYECAIRKSSKFGWTFHVTDVSGRSWVLIHGGNFGGDKAKGWKTHTAGCLLLGKHFGQIGNQLAVLLSKVTLRRFMNYVGRESFTLQIQEAFGG